MPASSKRKRVTAPAQTADDDDDIDRLRQLLNKAEQSKKQKRQEQKTQQTRAAILSVKEAFNQSIDTIESERKNEQVLAKKALKELKLSMEENASRVCDLGKVVITSLQKIAAEQEGVYNKFRKILGAPKAAERSNACTKAVEGIKRSHANAITALSKSLSSQ
jgi:hypothetical protein